MTTLAQLQEIAEAKPNEKLEELQDAIVKFALCPSTDSLRTVVGLWACATRIAGLL